MLVCRHHVTWISCRRCCLLDCLQGNEELHSDKCFYTLDDVIKPHFCYYDIIILFSDWLAHSQSCHLVGISFISCHFKCKKVTSRYFWLNFQTYRMCFLSSPLNTICVELALAVISTGQTRYELLGLTAASEYDLTLFIFQLCSLTTGGSKLFA